MNTTSAPPSPAEALRPVVNEWLDASLATPFAADLIARSPRDAIRHFTWEAVRCFATLSADARPTVGSRPDPGASSAVAGGSLSSGDRVRDPFKTTMPDAGCRMPEGGVAR